MSLRAVHGLSALGFGPFFERQLEWAEGDPAIPARIAAEHRGAYEVWSRTGAGRAELAGRLRSELEDAGAPGVGDWVVVSQPPGPECTTSIQRVLTRRTAFTRGVAGRQARTQVVAANVDLVFAAILWLSGMGLSLWKLVGYLERRVITWR